MYKRIKIFTISTNQYHIFDKDFLDSFSFPFLPNVRKEFFLFTDEVDLDLYKDYDNVNTIYIEHEKWPMITLKRYENISKIFPRINEDDLCIFADIDLEVVREVNEFPVTKYFGVNHPGNYIVDNRQSLEDNPLSKACVDVNFLPPNYNYIQGCFWGGVGTNFINMVKSLEEGTSTDLANNIIAKWHDESHLNKFCIENISDFEIVPSSFAYPENWRLPVNKIIIHKDKSMEQFPRFEGSHD